MSWSEHVFLYCERGRDAAFWAEPLNALSNGAFLLAAAVAAARLWRGARTGSALRGQNPVLWGLIGLVATIGVGSFLFHTYATRWAMLADVVPITVFMVAYLAYALRVFLGIGWLAIAGLVALFLLAGQAAAGITCGPQAPGELTKACLNGSLGYAPALVSLWAIGLVARQRGLDTGGPLLAGGVLFLVAATLRTVDPEVCDATHLLGHPRGTHALWHLLNAVMLYLLLRCAIDHGGPHDREGNA